jgi:hypothetical protein
VRAQDHENKPHESIHLTGGTFSKELGTATTGDV